jgi:NTE family protein
MSLRHWLDSGPFTLALSSGFFGFFAHTGMLCALLEAGYRPARAAGCSAGALVGGAWAAGVEPDVLVQRLMGLERAAFWDPGWGPGLLRGERFRDLLLELLPVRSFEECHTPLTISVFDVRALRTRSLDQGELAPAIQASCSVPLMFHPVRHAGQVLLDGGLLDRPGLAGVPADSRVLYHHLPSRVPWAPLRSVFQREPPRRAQLVTLVLDALPRSDPFRIEAGRRALQLAHRDTQIALDRALDNDMVRV